MKSSFKVHQGGTNAETKSTFVGEPGGTKQPSRAPVAVAAVQLTAIVEPSQLPGFRSRPLLCRRAPGRQQTGTGPEKEETLADVEDSACATLYRCGRRCLCVAVSWGESDA